MDRRSFIRLSVFGVTSSIITPKESLASSSKDAGHSYLTQNSPGPWGQQIGIHLPRIGVLKEDSKTRIKVVTPHTMHRFDHYISHHIIMNEDFKTIADRMFDPLKDRSAISHFQLGNYRGRIHVLSVCNRHSTWLNHVDV